MSVVLVPGLGGCILEDSNSKTLWPTLDAALPFLRNKWKTRIQTSLEENGWGISSSDKIRPRNFGGLQGVETLYEINWKILDIHIIDYFREIVDFLQKRGISDIHGAPYDFRLLPDPRELKDYFNKLKKLIENAEHQVILIGHSLGSVVVTIFLNRQSKEWTSKYIKRFVSISGPFGGATKAIHACLTGDTETPVAISTEFYRQIEIGFGGVLWMINNPEVFPEDIVNNLNANQIGVALSRRGSPKSAMIFEHIIRPLHKEVLKFPEVPTVVIHGTGIATPYKLEYPSNKFTEEPEIEKSDGDGTVPLKSLQAVVHWKNLGEVDFHSIFKAGHLSILKTSSLLKILGKYIKCQ